jgi:hypothetical protein
MYVQEHAMKDNLESIINAWHGIERAVFRWAFVSVGYVSKEHMARMNSIELDELEAHAK